MESERGDMESELDDCESSEAGDGYGDDGQNGAMGEDSEDVGDDDGFYEEGGEQGSAGEEED